MSGHGSEVAPPRHTHPVSRGLLAVSRVFALAGGAMFMVMIVLSIVSIVGRKLWNAPVNGDIEMLEMGTGIAAAAFFPYCTMMDEHLRVEFFTAKLPARALSVLDGVACLLLAVVMALLAWRCAVQAGDSYQSGEVTVMRGIPAWIPVACLAPSLALTGVCAFERMVDQLIGRFTGMTGKAP